MRTRLIETLLNRTRREKQAQTDGRARLLLRSRCHAACVPQCTVGHGHERLDSVQRAACEEDSARPPKSTREASLESRK